MTKMGPDLCPTCGRAVFEEAGAVIPNRHAFDSYGSAVIERESQRA